MRLAKPSSSAIRRVLPISRPSTLPSPLDCGTTPAFRGSPEVAGTYVWRRARGPPSLWNVQTRLPRQSWLGFIRPAARARARQRGGSNLTPSGHRPRPVGAPPGGRPQESTGVRPDRCLRSSVWSSGWRLDAPAAEHQLGQPWWPGWSGTTGAPRLVPPRIPKRLSDQYRGVLTDRSGALLDHVGSEGVVLGGNWNCLFEQARWMPHRKVELLSVDGNERSGEPILPGPQDRGNHGCFEVMIGCAVPTHGHYGVGGTRRADDGDVPEPVVEAREGLIERLGFVADLSCGQPWKV